MARIELIIYDIYSKLSNSSLILNFNHILIPTTYTKVNFFITGYRSTGFILPNLSMLSPWHLVLKDLAQGIPRLSKVKADLIKI
jgi:hypothetical protein